MTPPTEAPRESVRRVLEQGERLHAEHLRQRFQRVAVDSVQRLALHDAPRGRVADARPERELSGVRPALLGQVSVQVPSDRHGDTIAYNLPLDKSYTEAYNSPITSQ